MEKDLSWKDIVPRLTELTGSDLESESGMRGPIKAMTLNENEQSLTITCHWVARYYENHLSGTTGWHLLIRPNNVPGIKVDLRTSQITDLGEGMIRFESVDDEYFVLFPKHKNLDPKDVHGFPNHGFQS